MKRIVSLLLSVIWIFTVVSCGQPSNNEVASAELISAADIKNDVNKYFDISVEFQNIQWESRYNSFFKMTFYSGTSDMHIKVINKKHIDGVSLKIKILIKNTGDNSSWVDAYFLEQEEIEKTIYISSYGTTDVVIPRTTDNPETWKDRVPNEEEITIQVLEVFVDN